MTGVHEADAVAARLRAAGCVFAEEEAAILLGEGRSADETERMIARRCAGAPLETVVGWAAFLGLRIAVEPGVFVPRRRTEALALAAIEHCPADGTVVDLCCGAGAIGAAIAAARPGIRLHAADVDPVATGLARRNLPATATVATGDLFAAVPPELAGRIDVLAANVPYVATRDLATLPGEARDHEPRHTLDGGADGLDLLRRVLAGAPRWLAPGGAVVSEVAEHQIAFALDAAADAGLTARVAEDDDRDAHVLIATLGASTER